MFIQHWFTFPFTLFIVTFIVELLSGLCNSATSRAASFWLPLDAAIVIVLTIVGDYYDMSPAVSGETTDEGR